MSKYHRYQKVFAELKRRKVLKVAAVVLLRGKFLDVFRREADGRWILAWVSFSTDHE